MRKSNLCEGGSYTCTWIDMCQVAWLFPYIPLCILKAHDSLMRQCPRSRVAATMKQIPMPVNHSCLLFSSVENGHGLLFYQSINYTVLLTTILIWSIRSSDSYTCISAILYSQICILPSLTHLTLLVISSVLFSSFIIQFDYFSKDIADM